MSQSDFELRARLARDWMFEKSFPLWSQAGNDLRLGFVERLDASGQAIADPQSRVRVQARQTFCFALAETLGWQPERARAQVERGLDTLLVHCRRSDGLFGLKMDYRGGLADDTVDLYDSAFALLAFSWAARAGHARGGDAARALAGAIETHLARPETQGGFCETLPAPDMRAQNPHMHTFEASLAQFEMLADRSALQRARGIEHLLERRFLQAETGALREVFSADWAPAPGDRLEAGHQYEWFWLLAQRARLDGQPISPAADGLYFSALSLTSAEGAVALEHDLDGRVRDASERTWGLTEALKAHISRHEQGDRDAGFRIINSFDRLWERHIAPAPVEGGWLDRYDTDGQPQLSDMTAATGYHVYVAFAELMRLAGVR